MLENVRRLVFGESANGWELYGYFTFVLKDTPSTITQLSGNPSEESAVTEFGPRGGRLYFRLANLPGVNDVNLFRRAFKLTRIGAVEWKELRPLIIHIVNDIYSAEGSIEVRGENVVTRISHWIRHSVLEPLFSYWK